jgi:hypothetical protein
MYKIKLAIIGTVFMAVGLSSTAVAGEITGNGKSLKNDDGTLNGKSECAWSGREDEPESGEFKGPIAQAWGQLTKEARDFLTSIDVNPGEACNPKKVEGG